MLTLGQKILAFVSLLFVFGVAFVFSPVFSVLLVPITILVAIMLWKL